MKCRVCERDIGFAADKDGYKAVHLPANVHDRDTFSAGAHWLRKHGIREYKNGKWIIIPPEISKSSQYRLRKKLEQQCKVEWYSEH